MKHHVIFVPGLDDGKKGYDFFINRWKKYGVVPHVYRMRWMNEKDSFDNKLNKFLDFISKLQRENNRVSLVGNSAGASAVLNAYIRNPKIHAVVNSSGRLRAGENVHPSLDWAARKSAAFKESVLLFEKKEPKMTKKQRENILVLLPIWDEIVPLSTIKLKGAKTQRIIGIEHGLNGILAISVYSQKIMDFILSK